MRDLISVVGNGDAQMNSDEYMTAEKIGFLLMEYGYRLVCGGMGGVMEAACKGARSSDAWREGSIVGILPGNDPGDANGYVDIPVCTGTGMARNIAVASSRAVIAVGGGAGTLSEIALAWQLDRLILAWKGGTDLWSSRLAGLSIDKRKRKGDDSRDMIFGFGTAGEALALLSGKIGEY